MLFECGKTALFGPWQLGVSRLGGGQVSELWQPCVSKLGGGQKKKTVSLLSVQKATLGSAGRCTKVCSVLHCHAFWVWRNRSFRALAAGRFEAWRRASLRALAAVRFAVWRRANFRALAAVRFEAWRRAKEEDSMLLVRSESNVRQYRPLPGGPFRPSLPLCLSVARPLFSGLGTWKFRNLAVGRKKRQLVTCPFRKLR